MFWGYKKYKVVSTLGLQEPPQTHKDKELNSVMSNKRERGITLEKNWSAMWIEKRGKKGLMAEFLF